MQGSNNFYVYLISRLDGRPCYIGKGRGRRWKKHGVFSTNPHLANIFAQSKEKLPCRKLCKNLTEEEAFDLECELIKFFGREVHGGTLVNQTDGGEGVAGHRHTEESRRKMSLALMGRPGPWKGKRRSKEVREKLRQAKLGRPLPREHRKAISEALKGIERSPEFCAAVSAGKLGKKASEETKKKLRAANRSRDPEVRIKMSIGLRRYYSIKQLNPINPSERFPGGA